MLAEFGERLAEWPVPADQRGRDTVDARLREWTASTEHPSMIHESLLYNRCTRRTSRIAG